MIRLSVEEWKHMRERGITLCSLCRNENRKNPYCCAAGRNQNTYGGSYQCDRFISKKEMTPEERRIAAMRAEEAQYTLFGDGR